MSTSTLSQPYGGVQMAMRPPVMQQPTRPVRSEDDSGWPIIDGMDMGDEDFDIAFVGNEVRLPPQLHCIVVGASGA